MRSRVYLAPHLASLAALVGTGAIVAATQPEGRREPSPTRRTILDTGKPPMNGAREVARRLRQMQRNAAKRGTPCALEGK